MDLEDPMNIVESELPPVRLIQAHVPADLDTMSVASVIRFAQSMGKLNIQLTDAFNSMIKVAEQYGAAMSSIVDEYSALAERLELEDQAAAERASETSAAADWPGSLRPESLGEVYPESLGGATTVGEAIREGLAADRGRRH